MSSCVSFYVSIYGPSSPPPRDHAKRASGRLTRLVLAVILLAALTYVGVYASLEVLRDSSTGRLEVDRAARDEVDRRRSAEQFRLKVLPAVLEHPPIEIPAPLELTPPAAPFEPQTAEPLR